MVELIVYLEPSVSFKHQVETFVKQCDDKYGKTTASKYGCHITMTGFFHIEKEKTQAVVDLFNTTAKNQYSKHVPHVLTEALIAMDANSQPKHVLMPVTTPDIYHQVMKSLSEKCKPLVNLRLKKINHISLAYFDEPNATINQQNDWQQRVFDGVFEKIKHDADIYFKHIDQPSDWHVVLYKRVYKGESVGESHIFQELNRWSPLQL